MAASPSAKENASIEIDQQIKDLSDWRGETLAKARQVILDADPDVVEEIKWRKPSKPGGTPVWSCGGGICTGEVYKDKVKLTFFNGAALSDPTGLFNSSLEGKVRRAIDFFEGEQVNEDALKALILEAIALNLDQKQ